jgi:anti-sigma B factor antagonist
MEPFEVSVRAEDGAVVLDLRGELDFSAAGTLRTCLLGAIASADWTLVIDLREVTFIDAGGIAALLRARRTLVDQQRELRLQHTASIRRVFELAGVTGLLDDNAEASRYSRN